MHARGCACLLGVQGREGKVGICSDVLVTHMSVYVHGL